MGKCCGVNCLTRDNISFESFDHNKSFFQELISIRYRIFLSRPFGKMFSFEGTFDEDFLLVFDSF